MNLPNFMARFAAFTTLAITALFATNAAAQPSVDISSFAGGPGDPGTVTVEFTDQTPAATEVIDLRIQFDSTVVENIDLTGCNGASINGITVQCSNPNPGQVNILVFPFPPTQIDSGTIGTIGFDIAAGAVIGTYPIAFIFEEFTGAAGANITPSPSQSTLGDIIVQAPSGAGFYTSTPAPGGTITFPAAVVGVAATPDQAVSVGNASPDTDFDVTSVNATAPLSNADGFPITIPFGGSDDVTFTCTPDARGDINGTFEIVHNSASGATSPVEYNYECVGLAPNVVVPAGPVALSGLTIDANPLTAIFDVTNPQDGFTSNAENVSVTPAGDPQITATILSGTIAPNGAVPVTVSCDNTAAGNFTSTLTIEWDDPVSGGTASDTINATCDVTDAVASYASTPAVGATLAFGVVTNGVTSAPIGIDVTNDGVGPSPDSDLTITSATANNTQYTVNLIDSGPFVIGSDAGDTDIEVTCTPDAGSSGPLPAATLTVVHDGDDSPSTYPLTCSGQSDGAFASNPAAGGVLNLGVVPPNTTTPERSIEFSNNGATDNIQVSCSVTDPEGVFTFAPDPLDFDLAPGATDSAVFQCTPTLPSSFQADVACTITGDQTVATADYTVLCQGQPAVIPTMNQWGLIMMSLMLLLAGGLFGRRWFANEA